MNYEDILIEPVMTEKATLLREQGKYVFKVHPDASKIEIKEAVRRLFNVKVVDCTVMNVDGKVKRVRYRPGKTSSWKKAIVKLAPGESIKVFEGV
ncbi:MAG: 50S ribosomal protein L23 [Spirochaetaceae bacterium]|jgi:large subunit ribosomal protein L23|nr:50S ribosomal protein L23 [Spirochaetaceae bacterium]MBR3812905.1 50S ribosomal protein L23 [Spirochaetaceae bacterium]MDD6487999.1 50S ribosomal protein L23 [Spirochaetales bacterium]